jgi:hypothetical protein
LAKRAYCYFEASRLSIVSIAWEVGCPGEDVARLVAQRLGFEHLSERKLVPLLNEEFGHAIEDKAWTPAVESVLARLAAAHHLVLSFAGSEHLFPRWTGVIRTHLVATDDRRIGNIMLERRIERDAAKVILRERDTAAKDLRKRRVGRGTDIFDVTLNSTNLQPEQLAEILVATVNAHGPTELLTAQAEAQLRFQSRLQLASHGISANGKAKLPGGHAFVHPSEETFANLLDFYRVAWDYEPRSFPLQWDKDGNVLEAFTPDFYLPEFDLYVELTTMKQALVTKKNRKIKLLKAIYPHVNIQVFYQKDYQDLIDKYGSRD